jgi:hypothetical protein
MIRATVTALAYQIGKSKLSVDLSTVPRIYNKEANFIIFQMENMPDYLRLPFRLVTLFFGLHTILFYFKPFYRLKASQREKVILSWKNSRLSFCQMFIKFHESLIIVSVYTPDNV